MHTSCRTQNLHYYYYLQKSLLLLHGYADNSPSSLLLVQIKLHYHFLQTVFCLSLPHLLADIFPSSLLVLVEFLSSLLKSFKTNHSFLTSLLFAEVFFSSLLLLLADVSPSPQLLLQKSNLLCYYMQKSSKSLIYANSLPSLLLVELKLSLLLLAVSP